MTNALSRQLMLLAALAVISFQIKAASATTVISANIVPVSSLVISDSIVLGKKLETYQGLTQTKANGVSIETSSFNAKNSAKLKINSSHNALYDISISPSSTLTDSSSNKVEIKTMRALNNFESLNNNREQELVIEAVIKDTDADDKGLYFGTVEINVNYN